MRNIPDYKKEDLKTGTLSLEEYVKEYQGKKKVKKFFRFATPILIIEIIVVLALGVYLILLPKSFCKVYINDKNAIVYVNGNETNRFRLTNPKEETQFYYYEVDVDVKFPAGKDYLITYTAKCEDNIVFLSTNASQKNSVYSLNVKGGVKTRLFSALTIKSDTLLRNFEVVVDIKVQN